MSCRWLKYWTIAKPKPISAVAVRSQDIMVRSRLNRVRIQLKWLSEVTLTSNLTALSAVGGSAMPDAFLPMAHVVDPHSERATAAARREFGTDVELEAGGFHRAHSGQADEPDAGRATQ